MNWWRAYHGLPFDPKFAVIAKRCGLPRGTVAMVFVACLDYSSQQEERGSTTGIDAEEIAVSLDYSTDEVKAVLAAMEDRGIISDGRIAAWAKRQPKREDYSTPRIRALREREKRNETQCNAPDKIREEKSREEKNTHTTDQPRQIAPVADSVRTMRVSNSRFSEWLAGYRGRKADPEQAFRAWLSVDGDDHAAEALACRDRYNESSEVARGALMEAGKFIFQQGGNGWSGQWQKARDSPTPATIKRNQTIAGMNILEHIRRS